MFTCGRQAAAHGGNELSQRAHLAPLQACGCCFALQNETTVLKACCTLCASPLLDSSTYPLVGLQRRAGSEAWVDGQEVVDGNTKARRYVCHVVSGLDNVVPAGGRAGIWVSALGRPAGGRVGGVWPTVAYLHSGPRAVVPRHLLPPLSPQPIPRTRAAA